MILSLIFPRDEKIFVFGSETGPFADNSKYMFLQMAQNTSKKVIWICDDQDIVETLNSKGYEAYLSDSLMAKMYSIRAGYAIVDHYIGELPSWYVLGAQIVNLWHGFPYKKMGDSPAEGLKESFIKKFRASLYSEDYFLITSVKHENLLSGEISGSKIYAGYPRNDIFSSSEIQDTQIGSVKVEEDDFIIYLPTFRDKSGLNDIDLKLLDRSLERFNKKIILKPHPRTEIKSHFSNIEVIENKIDIYPLLNQSSALITDYSSVMFDYMYTGNPIIRFQFDKDQYKDYRGLNSSIEDLTPGIRVDNTDELVEVISNLENRNPNYESKIEEVFESRGNRLQYDIILDQIL